MMEKLTESDISLTKQKRGDANRLGFAVQLCYMRYPGILSGVHECALAAFGAMEFIFPEKKVFLQYTTTSPKLHKVLGVEMPNFD